MALLLAGPPRSGHAEPASVALGAATPAKPAQRWKGSLGERRALIRAARGAGLSGAPDGLAQLHRAFNGFRLLGAKAELRPLLERLAERAPQALVRDHARFYLAELERMRGAFPESAKALSRIGLGAPGWWIGPFPNAADAGHSTEYAPERGLDPKTPAPGLGHPVRWRPLRPELSPDGKTRLAQLGYPQTEGTGYLAYQLRTPRRERLLLRVGAGGRLRVWLDGKLAVDVDAPRTLGLDQEAVLADLRPGDHLVLIKLSWSGTGGDLYFRLASPRAGRRPATTIVRDEARAPLHLTGQGLAPSRVLSLPRRYQLDGALAHRAEHTKDARRQSHYLSLWSDLLAVSGRYDPRNTPPAPAEKLARALTLERGDPWMWFLYGHRIRESQPEAGRDALSQAIRADPNFAPAHHLLAVRQIERDLEGPARTHLAATIRADPSFGPARRTLARMDFQDQVAPRQAIALLQHPSLQADATAWAEQSRMWTTLGHPSAALEAARRALELDRSVPEHYGRVLRLEARLGHTKEVARLVDTVAQNFPHRIDAQIQRAEHLAANGEADAALSVLAKAQEDFPDHPRLPHAAAEIERQRQNRKAAIAWLDHALSLDPHQPRLRKRRNLLAGHVEPLEAQLSVSARALAREPISALEQAHGVAYLTDRTGVELYANGKTTRFRQIVLRLQNPRLKDALRIQRIPYTPSRESVEILSAERIRRDGSVVSAPPPRDAGPRGKVSGMYIDRRYKILAFDDLRTGDVIHLKYRIDSVGAPLFGDFFGDIEAVHGPMPKREWRYSVHVPKARTLFTSDTAPQAGPPVVRTTDDARIYEWTVRDVAPVEVEPMAPPYPEIGRVISVSTYENWADLGRWFSGLFRDQMVLDPSTRAAGRRATRGLTERSAIIRRLYNYVVQNTRYVGIELGIHGWKPFKASEVHRRRYGDCKDKATLLAALLRDQGIDATIALVRTADRGRLPEDHATMWAFNHAVTYVPSERLFLDGTAEFSGSTELPELDQGAQGLVVHPDGRTEVVTLPISAPTDNENRSRYVANFQPDGSLILEGEEHFRGVRAANLRQEFEEEESRKRNLEKQLGQVFPGISVEKIEFSALDDLEAPVSYRYRARIPKYGQRQGNQLAFPVALFQHQVTAVYGKLSARSHDLYVGHPWSTRNEVEYRLPPGAAIVDLPKAYQHEDPHWRFEQTIKRTPNGFVSDDRVTFRKRRVRANAYPAFRSAAIAIDQALSRRVVIQWESS